MHVPANPDGKVTVGATGMANPALNVTLMVLVAASAPEAEVVKPTVHVEVAPGVVEPGVKVTPVGEVGVITTALAGWPTVSVDVVTPKVAAA